MSNDHKYLNRIASVRRSHHLGGGIGRSVRPTRNETAGEVVRMIPYFTLIKIGLFLLVLVSASFYLFQHGRAYERAEWELKEKGRIHAQGIELRNAMQRVADHIKATEIYHARVQNDYQDKVNLLTRDLAASQRLRLSVQKPGCDSGSLSRLADSGKKRDDTPGQPGVRDESAISESLYLASEETLNSGITNIWEEHQRLKLWAEQLLARCAPRFDVRD
jgi:hypothetical protein